MPHPSFESYDLAHSSHPRISYRNDEDLFDTLFPQPPPRSRLQAERLARPSLPTLKPSLHLDSADSSRSTTQPFSSSNSVDSVNSLSSYPSSTSSLSLLHSIHPNKQASTDSSIDYYSPAISDVNSADTDHSVSSGRAHSQASEVDSHEQAGPFTPLTPNGPAQTWRPKELNLVRKRQAPAPVESSLPLPQGTPNWNTTPTTAISGDRNALLIGLGLGGVSLDPVPSPAPLSATTPQSMALSRSRSPQLVSSTASSRDGFAHSNGAPTPAVHPGPKQLILVSSGGLPAVRRFPGRKMSEGLVENSSSPTPPPASEASSRSNTPQMRSAIPVLPSGPAFVANRALSPDIASIPSAAERSAGLSAQEFLAQIASTPEYQASEYFDSAAFGASPALPSSAQQDYGVMLDRSEDADASEVKAEGTPTLTTSSTPAASALTTKAPGFSWNQRSRAASLSKRKPPPAPLVLTSSPATSASDTLPGSAGGLRRRSLSATITQRSPLSAPDSANSGADAQPPVQTSASTYSTSNHRHQDSVSDYSEPLRTAFYDFDSEDDVEEHGFASKPSSEFDISKAEGVPPSAGTTNSDRPSSNSAVSAQRNNSQSSAMSSRIISLRSEAQNRQSSGSGSTAAAFEFDDLEIESASESLSLETMMGFLQRHGSHKASSSSSVEDVRLDSQPQEQVAHNAADLTITQASPVSPTTASPMSKQDERSKRLSTASTAPAIPSFNIAVFGPSQNSKALDATSVTSSLIPKNGTQEERGASASVPPSPSARTVPSRKQSIVPAPPSFAIHDAQRVEGQAAESGMLLPAIAHGVDSRPAAMARANSNELGNSRWSSGSESDGDAAMSIKGGRKSFSKGRKSFSSSRKNSVPFVRESSNVSAFDSLPENGRRQSKSGKTSLSGSSSAAIVQPQPVLLKPSMSKRLFLSGLPSFRKKSFSNLGGQSASPSTPNSSREPVSAGMPCPGATEFPFPPSSESPQSSSAPPLPSMTSRPLNHRVEPPQLSIKTALASTFASANLQPVQSPRSPISAAGFASSMGASGPLTTQQILAQSRNNVWPENYIGNSVSTAGMTSPYLSASHDAFNHTFLPSRLAPTPPYSGSANRLGWSSAPHTSPVPQSPRFAGMASHDKSLPGTPVEEITAVPRSRSRTAEIAPPRNLRHIRQSSSNSNLDKMSKDVPADLFRPCQAKPPAPVAHLEGSAPSSQLLACATDEEKLPTISESAMRAASLDEATAEVNDVNRFAASISILVDRKQAKLKKAQRIRKQNDRFARYNSWSEYGLHWLAEQGDDAFDRLAAEGLPSTAVLAAAGSSSSQSHQTRIANGGPGGGDDDSEGSDTDDYGSSDGGGGGGGGSGGAGGAGGGKHPSEGGDDADDSEDEDEEDGSDDDDEDAEAMTDKDSEDDYGTVEQSAAARTRRAGAMPAVPSRNASTTASGTHAETAADSDSSDDRPLGNLVHDPKALQKALRAKERKRHFDLAAQALEGKGNSSASASTSSHARHAVQRQVQGQANEAPVNPNELSQRLTKVQGRRERAQARMQAQDPNAALMQRSQTVARQDVGRSAAAAVSRSKSVRTTPAERSIHPGMRARTPSEAALRAKAMTQAMPQGPSPIVSTLPNMSKMPELPSNAMATVVAAQKAMAHAQANPTPAALAQAQALATSATAALNAATAQVKRTGSSPISPTFNPGEPMTQVATSPRIVDGAEFPVARRRENSRGQALPTASSGTGAAAPAMVSTHQPGMLQRLRSRSVSRPQAPMTINTAAAHPMPDLPRPSTASKDSQASSSPHSSHAPTFAALSQAAKHHGRPSVDSSTAHGDASTQRFPSALPGSASASHEGSFSHSTTPTEPRQPHKVFILSRQRFTVVEVPVSARARDLALEVVERERLPMDDSKGGWVVFDCSAQLGIERPLREYEMITDVVNVRAHPRTDYFLIKRTELSPYLSIRSVPSSSPALAGWVYVQDRKKKWNKRWLELRDHGLYHAKNEKGKDETTICQISTFDVYLVDSSAIKMPKANGFALRSQDPITMFEKPEQDYMHYFCLTDPAAHRDWVRAILNARTYILRQEKAVLFQVDSPTSQDLGAAGGLSRKVTSRRPNGRPAATVAATSVEPISATGPSPPTPLIDGSAFAGPFAKGSLLADKAISDAKEALRGYAAVAPPTGAFNDLSLMERNAVRSTEARRREEAIERQRRMKADGQPLIDLVRK
ncbi:hypothetical protein EX895_001505 [Sporisorium graminicola]|uniref:PH domain-containing protein n=1 Tax=Sporisorium graminicola TaxID=280036 RepID=A0A4U7KYS5_9BASI|nr:hypothetical protein EX895_001505 [Sporisorium graminicola]TKY89720.1 hypothetical protein EX895_001505 [Sporisorium graminicola]